MLLLENPMTEELLAQLGTSGVILVIMWHWVKDLRKRLDRCERDHSAMRNDFKALSNRLLDYMKK